MQRSISLLSLFLAISCSSLVSAFVGTSSTGRLHRTKPVYLADAAASIGTPTDLPDSLEDAAEIAAASTASFIEAGGMPRCRVDFDTSVGDETYPILKTSSEFMQKYVTALCYALIPGVQELRQKEMMKVVQARTELKQLFDEQQEESAKDDDGDENEEDEETTAASIKEEREKRMDELKSILATGGRDPNFKWEGPIARIYFPDEGNAALARRDWTPAGGLPEEALVPPCVEFSSCGGVQVHDVSNDMLIFFFCPKASESESVEELLQKTEETSPELKGSVFVNPNLVDMGVTGYGMAGRMLRERLIENLTYTYYLRTLQWGALTRLWPNAFTVWQEDENSAGGYRMIKAMNRLPSNPEVEDIYDIENGLMSEKQSGGVLDQLGDFMNGMMKL